MKKKWKKTRFAAQPPINLMFEIWLEALWGASNCSYFVGFKGIMAHWHGHVVDDLFTRFLKTGQFSRLL